MVERLLLGGRMRLALTATVNGAAALFTHAVVTTRELRLGMPAAAAATAAAPALNARLDGAVDAVRAAWTAGERAALDLHPVHVTGTSAREGGGLLYHRPARPDRGGGADTAWELGEERPRGFDPRTLHRQLVQVAGHSHHRRCAKELNGWVDASAPRRRRSRSVRSKRGVDEPSYIAGVATTPGSLILIDPHFADAPLEAVELLPVGAPSL